MWEPTTAIEGTVKVKVERPPPDESIDARLLRERQERLQARYPNRKLPTPPRPRGPMADTLVRLPRVFDAEQVNVLQRMCARHTTEPFRFICIADTNPGFSPNVEWLPTPDSARALASIPSPEGPGFPSCYRRLWVFSEEAQHLLGHTTLFCTDVDAVVVNSMEPLLNRSESFVGWRPARDWGAKLRIGGGTYLLRTGAHRDVWDDFVADPAAAIRMAREAGYRGSDQAWMSYKLAGRVPVYDQHCGIYSVRDLGPGLPLPDGAILIHFNGHAKPQHYKTGQVAPVKWVLDHWR